MTRLPKIGDVLLLKDEPDRYDHDYIGTIPDGSEVLVRNRDLLGVRFVVAGVHGDVLTVDDRRGRQDRHARFLLRSYLFGHAK